MDHILQSLFLMDICALEVNYFLIVFVIANFGGQFLLLFRWITRICVTDPFDCFRVTGLMLFQVKASFDLVAYLCNFQDNLYFEKKTKKKQQQNFAKYKFLIMSNDGSPEYCVGLKINLASPISWIQNPHY